MAWYGRDLNSSNRITTYRQIIFCYRGSKMKTRLYGEQSKHHMALCTLFGVSTTYFMCMFNASITLVPFILVQSWYEDIIWLVVSTDLKNMTSSVGMIIPNIWKIIQSCSKPPASYVINYSFPSFPKSCGFGNQNKGGKPLNPPKSIGLSILQFPTKHRLLEKLEHPPCVTLPAINLPKGKSNNLMDFLWDIDIDGIIILTSNISSKSMVYPMILFSISSHKPAFLMVKLPFVQRLSAAVSSTPAFSSRFIQATRASRSCSVPSTARSRPPSK